MKLTWLGHSGFRMELGEQVLLIDPWLDGNPSFPEVSRETAITGTTHILLTHGHFDHANSAVQIAQETGAPILGMVELAGLLDKDGVETIGFNIGGTVMAGDVAVTMVPARHSSSMMINEKLVYAGDPAGFMISYDGRVTYVSGDTGIMADMEWMGDLFKPEIGILCAGGHFTMDMTGAAYAAKKYFDFKTVIPCHYKTFPLLEQNAEPLKAALPDVDVREPVVLEPMEL
ncbi:MAG: metal-dependent hydrolase [Pseudomonadota bacterium]